MERHRDLKDLNKTLDPVQEGAVGHMCGQSKGREKERGEDIPRSLALVHAPNATPPPPSPSLRASRPPTRPLH